MKIRLSHLDKETLEIVYFAFMGKLPIKMNKDKLKKRIGSYVKNAMGNERKILEQLGIIEPMDYGMTAVGSLR